MIFQKSSRNIIISVWNIYIYKCSSSVCFSVVQANVVGALCDECKNGAFNLAADNPEGCLQCFCMGVTKQCASSTWSRDQVTTSSNLVIIVPLKIGFNVFCFYLLVNLKVRGGVNGQLFTLSNAANTRTISEGITQRASAEVVYRSFTSIPNDIYYWVLPQNFRGDKVRTFCAVQCHIYNLAFVR